MDAVERLNRFKEEFKIRERKHELYSGKKYRGKAVQIPANAHRAMLVKRKPDTGFLSFTSNHVPFMHKIYTNSQLVQTFLDEHLKRSDFVSMCR